MESKTLTKEKNRALYTNANTYRLHQDNLRWTLAGVYGAFLAGSIKVLSGFTDDNSLRIFALIFLLIDTAYLLILGVENWYYNLFSQYVKKCEELINKNKTLTTLKAFATKKVRDEITPIHASYVFVITIVTLGNCYYIYALFSKCIFFSLVIMCIYIYLIRKLFRKKHWKCIYNNIIIPYQNIWT